MSITSPACDSARIDIDIDMTLEDFHLKMESYRRLLDGEAVMLKNPQLTLEKLRAFYKNLDPTDRRMADKVLTKWALSEDETLRFDGLALIYQCRIRAAESALIDLANRLKSSDSPSAPYELKRVERILVKLKTSMTDAA